MIKLSEQVRRLEDSIDSLREENKKLRDNWNTPDVRDEIIDHQNQEIDKLKKEIDRCKKLNDTLINNARADDEKYKKLERELWARVKQVEDLQSSYKVLQEENKKLKSKLEQKVNEYDKEYQENTKQSAWNDYHKRLNQQIKDMWKSRLDDMFNKRR